MSDRNIRFRRVSGRQLEILWEFLCSHRDIASAYNRSLQAKEYSCRKWREIAETLNAIGDGVHKDWRGWSKYWVDFKAKLKKKVATLRASQARTGGGPSTEAPLSEIEVKFLGILGEDFGQGLPGIRVEPFAGPSANVPAASPEVEVQESASESILLGLNTAAIAVEEVQDPPQSDSIFHAPSELIEIPAAPSPTRNRTPSPHPSSTPAPAAAAAARQSPRRRRRRRDPPMSQEAARRALVQSSQMRAEAAVRSAAARERMAESTEIIRDSLLRIERDVDLLLHKLYGDELPCLILVGHSMGGAIAVRAAQLPSLQPYVEGLAVIDVVEGTAMEALASMQSFLRGRPTHFKSIEHAIEWCVRSGQVRNVDSAKVSMPSQIVNCDTGLLATNEVETYTPAADASEPAAPTRHAPLVDRIAEEEEQEEEDDQPEAFPKPSAVGDCANGSMRYKWRIDLSRTEHHWSGWFKGLSAEFLSVRAPKLLLLASIDGLDKELMVGQMQGKFQMQVLTRCGHAVHEDTPNDVARAIAGFALRYRLTEPTENGEHMQLTTRPGC